MEFLQENLGTIIVAVVLAAIVAAIIIRLARRMRSGGCATGCDCCSSCGGHGSGCEMDETRPDSRTA